MFNISLSEHATPQQEDVLVIAVRTASVLSMIGSLFVITTFLFSQRFQKPINRLIFFAVFGNLLLSIGTVTSLSGPRAGPDSGLCQMQGFLIQMFLSSDALWNLSMAINVYLTVFKKYNSQWLRQMEKYYIMINYGGSALVAVVYAAVGTEAKGKIYGDATLWCWVRKDWDPLRIATLYAPAWITIFICAVIYIMTGVDLYSKQKKLQSFKILKHGKAEEVPPEPVQQGIVKEVVMSSESTDAGSSVPDNAENKFPNTDYRLSQNESENAYRVRIESNPEHKANEEANVEAANVNNRVGTSMSDPVRNRATLNYCYTAMLFFLSLLITWIPSSVFRVSAFANAPFSLPLAYTAATVLSLTGFWNTCMYIITSWRQVKELFRDGFAVVCTCLPARRAGGADDLYEMPREPPLSSRFGNSVSVVGGSVSAGGASSPPPPMGRGRDSRLLSISESTHRMYMPRRDGSS